MPTSGLLTVAFGGGLNLLADDNSETLKGPHWVQTGSTVTQIYPYLYKKGFTLKLDKATWLFDSDLPADASVYVLATTNQGFFFIPQLASVGADKRTVTIQNFVATALSLPPTTLFFDKLDITFQISINGTDGEFKPAGRSSNPVYVCIGNPDQITPNPPPLYQTTVHLACSPTPGASDADGAVVSTFKLFSTLSVCCWNWTTFSFSNPLYYYKAGTTYPQNQVSSLPDFLRSTGNNSGRCGIWAALLRDALLINGAITITTAVLPRGSLHYTFFIIGMWSFLNSGGPTWHATLSADYDEMQPPPDPSAPQVYNQLTSLPGLPGQNSSTPSEKIFINHALVKYTTIKVDLITGKPTTKYYDPSYGVTYLNAVDFQDNALAGVGRWEVGHPKLLLVDKPTIGVPCILFQDTT